MDHNTQKHTLKIFRWEEGLLKIEEHYTNSFQEQNTDIPRKFTQSPAN